MKYFVSIMVTVMWLYSFLNETKREGCLFMKLNIIILLLAAIYAKL